MWSVITPFLYIWANIDTRGHTEAPKSINIAVGPQDPPGLLPGSKTPGEKGLRGKKWNGKKRISFTKIFGKEFGLKGKDRIGKDILGNNQILKDSIRYD